MKRVIIVHGWDGTPEEGWFPWLKSKLESLGYAVKIPAMPNADVPEIDAWVDELGRIVGTPDKNTYFVGHSIGCQAVLRYLERLPANVKIGGAVFVAGWFTLMNLETDEEKEIARPWLETSIDLDKIKQHSKQFFAVFSDDDEVVPQDNKELFEKGLGAITMTEHNKGHFSGSDGITELPVVLDKIVELTG